MPTWSRFVEQGDEWLIAYACIPPFAVGASLFSVGHAVELYLKAVYVAKFGTEAEATKFGHRIWNLWDKCRSRDSNFMSAYQLRESVLEVDLLDGNAMKSIPWEDQKHIMQYSNLYLVFKHLPDLKYFGLSWKTRQPKPSSIAYVFPDPRWIEFFRELRLYLGYPLPDRTDWISMALDRRDVPEPAATYLRDLYVLPAQMPQ